MDNKSTTNFLATSYIHITRIYLSFRKFISLNVSRWTPIRHRTHNNPKQQLCILFLKFNLKNKYNRNIHHSLCCCCCCRFALTVSISRFFFFHFEIRRLKTFRQQKRIAFNGWEAHLDGLDHVPVNTGNS